MRLLIKIFLIILSFSTIPSYAQVPWREATAGNWRESPYKSSLPPFCGKKNGTKNPIFSGPNFRGDMTWGNHLCGALTKIPICQNYSGNNRIECLNDQTRGYTYWISHSKNPNFGLLPYLHTGLGGLYFEMGKRLEAINEYNIALSKNPKYLKAYKGIIDVYISIGDLTNAQHYLDRALSIKELKAFKKRQAEINKLKNLK
ncbi:MAG: type IV pilus biogenesis/stability protein PilW [Candidatus Reddybacter sp.]